MSGGIQLSLVPRGPELPLDPVELARVPIRKRSRLYAELELDSEQVQACETAIHLVVRKLHARGRRAA